ncbi:uncharacterized protein TM35_000084480, partial [Trypanosoma theileri]
MSMLPSFTPLSYLSTVAESELQATYDAAFERWKAAKQAKLDVRWEKDEKKKLAAQKPNGTSESYLAWAEYWRAEITFMERCQQEAAAEYENHASYANLMLKRYGVDSTAGQIAMYRLELTRTKEFALGCSSQYWTKWHQLVSTASLRYCQLKAEASDGAADEVEKAKDKFHDRINNESNGEAFLEAWNAALAALDRWEETGDCTAWDKTKRKYDAELEKWNEFKPTGEQYAKKLETRVDECLRWKESEKKYKDAVERYQAAEQAEAGAKKEMDEKRALAEETQRGTKEYYLALAEKHKAEMVFLEKIEQKYAAEPARNLCYTDWMNHKHGADSKEAQIAQHRAELARTKEFVYSDSSPYWTKWYKLCSKADCVLNQLKAEGYENVAADLDRAREMFWYRIKVGFSGEDFRNARNAAVVALDRWERENNRTDWDKAKPEYDSALAKWNAFIPKGEQYADELDKTINSCIKSFGPISDLFCGYIGESVAELQEQAKQDPHSAKDLELLRKYDAAAKIYQAAEQAEADAKKERDEKRALAKKTQRGTKEYYLAWAEKHKAEMVFIEKIEQRYAAEYKRDLCYTQWMKHKHGADSKEAQIAQHRAELARTMEYVYSDSSPYWTQWYKSCSKAEWVHYQLNAEGYDNFAADLDRTKKAFCDRIKEESNGEDFRNARDAAVGMLRKWERWNNRTDWDKAKRRYSAELAKWNEFKLKGNQYAEELEESVNLCIKSFVPISDLFCGYIGESVAELQEQAKQDPHSAKGLALLKKYDAAAKIYQAAEQAEADAKKEIDEKGALAEETEEVTKEYYFAWAEKHKAEVAFAEKIEQRYAAEYKRDLCYADWMKHERGTDSKEAQIAQHHAELARTKEYVYSDSSPYWIKWYKLCSIALCMYYQLKAEGYDNVADKLDRTREMFFNRIEEESNGEALCNARYASLTELGLWQAENDCTDWDEAKSKYDAELKKWKEFQPKGEEYALILESRIKRLSTFDEAELKAKHNDAVKRWEAAKHDVVIAEMEENEKWDVTVHIPWLSKEWRLAQAEYDKVHIDLIGKMEREYAAEHEMYEVAVTLMIHEHGGDSKAAQIAMCRAELASTKEFARYDYSPYWTKWSK